MHYLYYTLVIQQLYKCHILHLLALAAIYFSVVMRNASGDGRKACSKALAGTPSDSAEASLGRVFMQSC
jgi:hypothetical protein